MNAFIKLIDNCQTASIIETQGGQSRYLLKVDNDFLHKIGGLRYENVYLWDAAEIFAIIDAYALNHDLLDYENIPLNEKGYKPRIGDECISRRDGDGVFYERKLWLKTIKTNSTDRHKRLSATTYINVKNFFGGLNFEEACAAFEVNEKYTVDESGLKLFLLMDKFSDEINYITGIKVFNAYRQINFWSMGGISKAYYLKLFEQKTEGIKYKDFVPQNEEFEIEMRLSHLLAKGVIYCKKFNAYYYDVTKYDVNSLFPFVAKSCPIFYPPTNSTWDEYRKTPKSEFNKVRFIITFNRLLLEVKPEYPNVLQPYGVKCTDTNSRILEYKNQSFFSEHLETLLKIYDMADIDVKAVYKLRIEEDEAIGEFVDSLYNLKKQLKGGRRTVVKFLLNNLHGKFAQLCLLSNFEYNKDENGILTRRIKSLRNNWKKSHFDYIRGAYIYSMAQRQILEEMIKLPRPKDIAYIDTDCFIVDAGNAPQHISNEIGEFKEELYYARVMFYAPKTYIGYDINSKMKIVAAGLNATEIKHYICGGEIPYDLTTLENIPDLVLPTTVTRRTVNGFEKVIEWRKIGNGLKDKDYNQGLYINGTEN